MKFLKKLLFWILILAAVGVLFVLFVVTYIEINSSDAKEYLLFKYGFKKKELIATQYVQYAYEDITDCSSLWFKECTKEEGLLYKYVFKTKDGETITVLEHENEKYTDNYDGETTDKYNEEQKVKEEQNQDEAIVDKIDDINNIKKEE